METPNRHILHLDLDSFFVSVACLLNPLLKGKPVAIGEESNRSVVSSCSYEARRYGVRSAMPVYQAKRLCPQLIVVSHGRGQYGKYSGMVAQIIANEAPIFQQASIDEFYLDLTGLDRFFGCFQWASQLRQRIIKETGLPISFGLATNKMVAKVATGEAKPNGQLYVQPGTEKQFLAPLTIDKIPMAGDVTCRKLRSMGMETVKQLQNCPIEHLQRWLGKKHGELLWQRAQGIDHSQVQPDEEDAKSVSKEHTFETDVQDNDLLRKTIVRMTEKLAYQLRRDKQLSACVTIKLRLPNFETCTRQTTIAATCFDKPLTQTALQIFDQLRLTYPQPVRLIGVRLSNLTPTAAQQLNLFEPAEKLTQLYTAIDWVKTKYGAGKLVKAQGF
ncbi:DNA polymerase IV [Sphingobacteriales bacterium UPWRP_1]|nr:hypothetical protein B6N25_17115 [Sphingobacteriales bacterium TSM_CSS]PSJ73253.1 DNA polymerase IV [Sphingobacteriales bacterium UPWRP_1]